MILDGLAKDLSITWACIRVADMVLIACQPSPDDTEAIEEVVEMVESTQSKRQGIPTAAFLLNRVKANATLTKHVKHGLLETGIDVLNTMIGDREGYKQSSVVGQTVFEYSDFKVAQREFTALADEIYEAVGV